MYISICIGTYMVVIEHNYCLVASFVDGEKEKERERERSLVMVVVVAAAAADHATSKSSEI